jgi:choline dehydrogenase-like flavoprotein
MDPPLKITSLLAIAFFTMPPCSYSTPTARLLSNSIRLVNAYIQYEITKPLSLYKAQWKFPHNMIRIGLQWFATQTGDAASAHLEAGGFIRSMPGVEYPDIQFHFLPSTVNDHGRKMGDRHAMSS